MGTILEEFKVFLQSILDTHTKGAGDTADIKTDPQPDELQIFFEDYNTRSIDRALEILSDSNLTVDKEKLKVQLSNVIREYSQKFVDTQYRKD